MGKNQLTFTILRSYFFIAILKVEVNILQQSTTTFYQLFLSDFIIRFVFFKMLVLLLQSPYKVGRYIPSSIGLYVVSIRVSTFIGNMSCRNKENIKISQFIFYLLVYYVSTLLNGDMICTVWCMEVSFYLILWGLNILYMIWYQQYDNVNMYLY